MYKIEDNRNNKPMPKPVVYDMPIIPEKRRDLYKPLNDNFEDELSELFNGMKPMPKPDAPHHEHHEFIQDDSIIHYDGEHEPHIHTNEPSESMLKLVYSYDNIYEEVYKRTSFLAKFRPTDTLVHQLNTMSFTRDEDFMFKPFILEASSNVFEKLAPFCKNIRNAFDYNEHVITYEREQIPNIQDFLRLGEPTNVTTTLVDHDDARGSVYEVAFEIPVEHIKPVDCSKYVAGMVIEMDYTTKFYGETVHNTGIIESKFSTRKNVIEVKQQIKVNENVYGETVESLGCVNEIRIKKYGLIQKADKKPQRWLEGNYVELVGETNHLFRIMRDTFSNADLKDYKIFQPVDVDDRDSVIFKLHILDWMDENAFKGLDNAVFECIVDFVMYKWFLIVAPAESQGYFDAYDNALSQVMYRVNQQKKPIHRKYHLF